MSSQASRHTPSETTDELTIRLLHEEITDLQGQAGLASDREVGLAASLLAADGRARESDVRHHKKWGRTRIMDPCQDGPVGT